jgi:hypothetical protein
MSQVPELGFRHFLALGAESWWPGNILEVPDHFTVVLRVIPQQMLWERHGSVYGAERLGRNAPNPKDRSPSVSWQFCNHGQVV